ncbi:hypothetical protein [Nocardia sp. NPDC057455]|uniref:hypothetical protein n=1 Tax=Nocardia sp. NPDC057455 TaxID=3346138 RepID=UPI00366C7C1E
MMSTLTEHRADSIEHLDHEPECDGCSATAVFGLRSHGCMEALGCVDCTKTTCDHIDAGISKYGSILCRFCHKAFQRRTNFTEVVPL